jgi:uncharacterized protein YutE (UPF0331/DUF86 family)
MRLEVNEKLLVKETTDEITKIILDRRDRYYKNVMSSNEVSYIFLKSVIYLEEIVKDINFELHATSKKYVGLDRQITQLELIRNGFISEPLRKLKLVNGLRNKLAHDLEYEIENDTLFLKETGCVQTLDLQARKEILANYFGEIVYHFLYLQIGIQLSADFIKFVRE